MARRKHCGSWLHANVRLVAAKKGMIEALQLVAFTASSELKAYSFDRRLTKAIGLLLDRTRSPQMRSARWISRRKISYAP